MPAPTLHPSIAKAIRELEAATQRVRAFEGLRPDQLSWQPAPTRWSIAQCLDHLVVSNESYFPVLDRLRDPAFKPGFWERWSPFSRSIGRNMVATLGPEVGRGFKAPKLFQPRTRHANDPSIVARFIAHQDALIGKLQAIRGGEPESCIVTSPVAGLITLPFSDLLRILPGHEARHLAQAERLLKEPGFPS